MLDLYYPNRTKKAVSFTLDDGRKEWDEQIIPLLKSSGIKATFNLVPDRMTDSSLEELRARYTGFEIANHTKYHPYPYPNYCEEKDLHPYEGMDANGEPISLYQRGNAYAFLAEEDSYIACIQAGHRELASSFGEDAICGFVWPGPGNGPYERAKVYTEEVYTMIRSMYSRPYLTDASFALPKNWKAWAYNANHTNILDRAKEFEVLSLEEGDSPRWFCGGVHAVDYFNEENIQSYNSSENLKAALLLLGNKPDRYWYAGNKEICDYTTALRQLQITDTTVKNSSTQTLYLKADGKEIILAPGEIIQI